MFVKHAIMGVDPQKESKGDPLPPLPFPLPFLRSRPLRSS